MSPFIPPRQTDSYKNNYWHVIIFCASFGAIFGIANVIILFLTGHPAQHSFLALVIILISSTFISGLAGLLSVLLDKMLVKIGISGEARRGIAVYIIIVVSILTVGFLLLPKNSPFLRNQFIREGLLGCGLGGLAAIIYYQYWKYKTKVQALEIENKYLAELTAKDRQIKTQLTQIAVAEERNRIARDLHDSVSQGIHSLVYLIRSLRKKLPAPGNQKVEELIVQLEKTVDATLEELRRMILELKPSLLETHSLGQAMKLHISSFSQSFNIPVNFTISEITGLTSEQETALYRILQESLTNIQKHARATAINITFAESDPNQVILKITDNGIGFDPNLPKQGNGLPNMAARCQENKGEFKIIAEPGKGTTLQIAFLRQKA